MKRDDILTTSDIATMDRETEEIPQGQPSAGEPLTPLFSQERVQELRNRWRELQVGFVDEPQKTVRQADELVAQVMQDLSRGFADERGKLESQWDKGDKVSTEELRQALRRYRSFFERFLSM
jgi:ketosteroid isomerase-like protein